MTHSIRGRLLAWLLGTLVAAGLVIGYSAYHRAQEDIDDLLDYQLKQLAFSLSHQSVGSVPMPPDLLLPEPDFITQVWDKDGVRMFYSRPNLAIPMRPRPGFSNVEWNNQSWRVYTQLDGFRIIQVAHPLSLRKEMAADLTHRAVTPLAALLPLLGLGIWIIVGHALRPLSSISSALRARTPSALEPLPQRDLPDELVPLVGSLNDLLQRLNRALEVQRQFVADAAHELRSPLTAVQLQLQLVKRAGSPEERTTALERLERGVQRSTRLVQQLLILARQDPQQPEEVQAVVDLDRVAREVVADFEPMAQRDNLTLTLDSQGPLRIRGNGDSLRVMLGNLVDNAIRYTDRGSVTVRVHREGGEAILEVEDTGTGIPADERGRVFDRFYRVPGQEAGEEGSGLGLAIVKRVADRHGGRIALDSGGGGSGLRVMVRLPDGNSQA
ncbi:MAG TPA: ATP-binding protein [Burkholderiales bacterium]|nr:ATP-binding protein [Burkholderiales bacterium]